MNPLWPWNYLASSAKDLIDLEIIGHFFVKLPLDVMLMRE